jgi:hypothetical protein
VFRTKVVLACVSINNSQALPSNNEGSAATMKLSVALSLLVLLTCCVIEVASDANYAITFNAQAPIIEVSFSFKSPGSLILTYPQFVYQLDIPAVSPDSSNSGDAQAMWAGITTADGQTLFQNVIENQDGGPNSWFMEPVYCCRYVPSSISSNNQRAELSSPYSVLDGPVQGEPKMAQPTRKYIDVLNQVYQSDTLQASVIDDTQGDGQDSQWFDSLYIARNPADGQSPYAATVSLNTTQDRKSISGPPKQSNSLTHHL